ncbi:uncharacterized protein TNCV_4272341 [Trichonephila clavipes]|nr:uncharacterized protein TNCV_4272341 [Trichonephila clavipes]
MSRSISEIVRQLGFLRSTVSRVCQECMDGGQKKTSDRAHCKGQLALTVRCERRLRRIVRSQRSQILAQITTQLNDGASRTWYSLGSLVRVPTSLNAIRYVELLGDHLPPLIMFCYPHGTRRERPLHSTNELWTSLANTWQVIPVEHSEKLVESMPRRVAVVIKSKGGSTRY